MSKHGQYPLKTILRERTISRDWTAILKPLEEMPQIKLMEKFLCTVHLLIEFYRKKIYE